jgi:hypothetical protein
LETDGTLTLRFTNFHTSNGPDVHVVLAAAGDPVLQSATPGKRLQVLEVGALKGNEGDQVYTACTSGSGPLQHSRHLLRTLPGSFRDGPPRSILKGGTDVIDSYVAKHY